MAWTQQGMVTLINRTSKTLTTHYDGDPVNLEPGPNQVPEDVAGVLKNKFPIQKTIDPDTLSFESQLGVKEWGDPVTKLTKKDLESPVIPGAVPIKYNIMRKSPGIGPADSTFTDRF